MFDTKDHSFDKRDWKAAKRFFKKAVRANGEPEKVTIDKSGANKAAINTTTMSGTLRLR